MTKEEKILVLRGEGLGDMFIPTRDEEAARKERDKWNEKTKGQHTWQIIEQTITTMVEERVIE